MTPAYANCKWCGGKGCLSCKQQADIDYNEQFPNGPQPLFVADLTDVDDIELLKGFAGHEALEEIFGSGGDIEAGVAEFQRRATEATEKQAERKQKGGDSQ